MISLKSNSDRATDVQQVDGLAEITVSGARYQASAEIVVRPKFLDTIKEGWWVRWKWCQVWRPHISGADAAAWRDQQ
ncbi:hypothetical protein NJB93_19110 [Brucella intermedia]|uniref:hypothetical protein n=1 Tax=Brucella intermedia TaxID=94625 RepID=UPI00209B3852|nr:hypothetical protein [Brucella intermedia]MCO7728697.1 hypothetical protein [Brucella intermedia]